MNVLSLVIGTILIFSAEVAFATCGNGRLDPGECDERRLYEFMSALVGSLEYLWFEDV